MVEFSFKNDKKLIEIWKEMAQKITGEKCQEITSCSASDARHLPQETFTIVTSIIGGGCSFGKRMD